MSPNAAFNQKLHLIYLINDLLHHWLVALKYHWVHNETHSSMDLWVCKERKKYMGKTLTFQCKEKCG